MNPNRSNRMNPKHLYTYCIYAVVFIYSLASATQGVMLTSFIDHYSLQGPAQGLTGSMQSFGQAFSLFLIFWLAGKIPKPVIVTTAITCVVAILFTVSFAPPFVILCLLFGLLGLAFGMSDSPTSSLIADLFDDKTDDKTTHKYMSRLHGVFGLGGLAAPLIYLGLANAGLRWEVSIRIMAVALLAILVPYFIVSRYSLKNIELPETSNQKITRSEVKKFFQTNTNVLLLLCVLFYAFHQSIISIWINRYVSVFLETPALGTLSLSLFWAGITVSRLIMHKIPLSPVKIVLFGNIAAAAAICTGILSASAVVMTASIALTGFLNGVTIPVIISVGCEDKNSNTILPTNLIFLSIFFANMCSPLVVGALVEFLTMSAGIYLSAFSALVCGLLMAIYYRKKQQNYT